MSEEHGVGKRLPTAGDLDRQTDAGQVAIAHPIVGIESQWDEPRPRRLDAVTELA